MRRLPAPFVTLAALLALYLIAPFAAGLANMGAADWAGVNISGLLRASVVSVASATIATALVTLCGVPLAYVLARRATRGLALLGFVVQLPLALPPLSSGILLLFLFGYASPLGRITDGRLTDSFAGIVLAEAFVAAPFLIIAARSAFADIDPRLEDVVATLGYGPGAVFRRVSLSLAGRAILSGMLLTWLRAFGEFGATVMVAYHPYSLPVFTYVEFGEQGLPAMLPVLIPTVLAALSVMALSLATLPRRRRTGVEREVLRALAPREHPPAPDRAPALILHVRQSFGDFELDVEWRTQAKRLAILGASGSGKSLTLRLIAGLGDAERSGVQFGEKDLARLPPERREIAYVPQNYGLLPNLTVADQIRLASDCDEALASYWTTRLGLGEFERRRSADLSLGQQQRVALARALSRRSAGLILLDEPFSALDTPLRIRLQGELLTLQDEVVATTILVTHDPAEAMLLADELLLLDRGRVLQSGPVNEVFVRPVSELAARLLGAVLIGEGQMTEEGTIDIGEGVHLQVAGPSLAPGLPVGWAVRPYQLRFSEDGPYPAVVVRRWPVSDGQRRVSVRIGKLTLTFPTDPSCPNEGPCTISMDPQAVQVWPAAP